MKAGYTVFLNLLSPQDEFTYDLLPWALEEYTKSVVTFVLQKAKPKSPNKEFAALVDFVISLSNHFRATPSLVRYGACICLYSALKFFPQIVQENRQLYSFIVSGALDSDYFCQFLYISMLEVVKADQVTKKVVAAIKESDLSKTDFTHFNPVIRVMVNSIRHSDSFSTYDNIFCGASNEIDEQVTLGDILDEASRSSPPLAPKLIHRMANSLDYFSKAIKLRQLELIRVWAGRSDKVYDYLNAV